MKIIIIGAAGAGKSTLAKELSKKLDVFYHELDEYYWGPNWIPSPEKIFVKKVKEAIKTSEWIVVGDYERCRNLIWSEANIIIWLDYSFFMIFYRLLKRSFRRIVTKELIWGGNHETFSRLFKSNSILIWMLKSYYIYKKNIEGDLKNPLYEKLKIIKIKHPESTNDTVNRINKYQLKYPNLSIEEE